MRTISLRSAQNRFDKQGDEVCFEEFRAYRNVENSKKNVSILLRTKLNAQYTMRVAPFDVVGDLIYLSKLQQQNRDKNYVWVHNGMEMESEEMIYKYGVTHNACLLVYEEEEWKELCRGG